MSMLDNPAPRELRVTVEPIGPRALWRIQEPIVVECDDLLLGACGRNLPEGVAHMEMHCYGQHRIRLRLLAMGLNRLTLREKLFVLLLALTGRGFDNVKEAPGDGR